VNTVPNPAIDTAVQAIRAFGGDLTGFQAARVLPMWTGYPKLTEPDIIEIIARFGPTHCRFCGKLVEHDGTEWHHVRQVDMEGVIRALVDIADGTDHVSAYDMMMAYNNGALDDTGPGVDITHTLLVAEVDADTVIKAMHPRHGDLWNE
jgi:hypothetical protein